MDALPFKSTRSLVLNSGDAAVERDRKSSISRSSFRAIRLGIAWCIVITAVAGGIVWCFWLELPSGPAKGTKLNGQIPTRSAARDKIRVGTYNIHGGKGTDGKRDLDRIADTLHELDFIGLNEVHGAVLWTGKDQAATLGQKLGMAWLYAPTEQCWSGTHFGSAILSRVPVAQWERIPLEFHDGNGFRNVVESRIPYSAGVVQIMVTHLDRRTDRHTQLSTVFKRFLEIDGPAVLMGDLNTTVEDPQIRALLETPGVIDCVGTHVSADPPKRIDWIFARGLRCVDAGLTAVGPSDHPHAWAELELPPGTALAPTPAVN